MGSGGAEIIQLADVREPVHADCSGLLMCGYGGEGIAAIIAQVDGQSYVSINRAWVVRDRQRQGLARREAV